MALSIVPASSHVHADDDVERLSFNTRFADHYLLRSVPDRLLIQNVPLPEAGTGLPRPYSKTCKKLCRLVRKPMESMLAHFDYNGLRPFFEALKQSNKGKTSGQIRIDSQNEKWGSTCAGVSQVILRKLKEDYGVEGGLGFWRAEVNSAYAKGSFHHVSVIVECTDGFVEIEPTMMPRLNVHPFGQQHAYKDSDGCGEITVSGPGSVIPLLKIGESAYGKIIDRCCLNIANGVDIIMKRCVMDDSSPSESIPINAAHPRNPENNKPIKKVVVALSESKIFLKNLFFLENTGRRTKEISLKSLTEQDLKSHLEEFYQAKIPFLGWTFETPLDTLCKQIMTVISQKEHWSSSS